jgi:hypothetical protein
MAEIDLIKLQQQVEAIAQVLSRGGIPLKIKKRGRPAKKEKQEEQISKQHIKILEAVASAETGFPSEWLAKTALAAGYTKGNGASAMFRGRNPSLRYEIKKTIVLTKRGQELLELSRKHAKPAQPVIATEQTLERTNGEVKEAQPAV